jgi:4-carboxymuconolactone decarboxylase
MQADSDPRRAVGARTMEEVVCKRPPENPTLLEETIRDFGFAEIWTRPGLDRRSRYWISISASAATALADPLEDYVHGALRSGEISLAELREGVLHFAVYMGWPLGRQFDRIVTKVADALGLSADVPSLRDGPWDPDERFAFGKASYIDIMTFPSPEGPTPFYDAGIKNFVFGEMWMRPGLDQRARRWITLACVGASDSPNPIATHVYAAMKTGDATVDEMKEFVLHYAFELGWPKGSVMQTAVETMADRIARGLWWM